MDIERKGWNVRQSFSDDFVDIMRELEEKYGDKVFAIQGIAAEHLDLVQFSKSFFKSASNNTADISVDGNANVREKNIMQYNYEAGKAMMKLNSLYLLYKWVKKFYKGEMAHKALEKVVSGELFVNDLVNYSMPYCFAFDLRNLMTNGMNFFQGNMPIHPPKRSDSFYALLIQSTAYISNQIVGAASYPDFFVVLDYYYRKELGEGYAKKLRKQDGKEWYKVKNQFQNLIFSLNFPFRGNQSAFTNLSVMDKGFMEQLFAGYQYPDGTSPDLDSSLELSKVFFEYYSEINGSEGIFTFPVMTIAISLDENKDYIDPDFVDWAAEANCEKAVANIFQSPPNAFSSCCRL
jgi:anaerobic ribonucleoside-triphosphate reductase